MFKNYRIDVMGKKKFGNNNRNPYQRYNMKVCKFNHFIWGCASVIACLGFMFSSYFDYETETIISNNWMVITGMISLILSIIFCWLINSKSARKYHQKTGILQIINHIGQFAFILFFILFISIMLLKMLISFYPGETKQYITSQYKITTPGPFRLMTKTKRAKNGIKIHEPHSSEWFFVPFTKDPDKQYPSRILVKIKSNLFGSTLVSYHMNVVFINQS